MLTLNNLESVGLLFARGGRLAGGAAAPASVIDWARLKRAFGAINNDVDSSTPDDIAYVTSGYAPIFARVVEWVANGEWAARQEALKLLPGPQIVRSIKRKQPTAAAAKASGAAAAAKQASAGRRKKVMMVLAIGGLTCVAIVRRRTILRSYMRAPLRPRNTSTLTASSPTLSSSLLIRLLQLHGDRGDTPHCE